jgi:hypothetical protein
MITLFLMISSSVLNVNNQALACLSCNHSIIEKASCDSFTVKISFQNTGKSEGSWSINVAFEGESWNWNGTTQFLSLSPDQKETLIWYGKVPENAPINSIARLVVYYGDSFVPQNWWIKIIPGSELTISSSIVE